MEKQLLWLLAFYTFNQCRFLKAALVAPQTSISRKRTATAARGKTGNFTWYLEKMNNSKKGRDRLQGKYLSMMSNVNNVWIFRSFWESKANLQRSQIWSFMHLSVNMAESLSAAVTMETTPYPLEGSREHQKLLLLFLQVSLKNKGYQWCPGHSTAHLRSVCERVRRGTWWQRRTGSTFRKCRWRRRCSPAPCAPPSASGPHSPAAGPETRRRLDVTARAQLGHTSLWWSSPDWWWRRWPSWPRRTMWPTSGTWTWKLNPKQKKKTLGLRKKKATWARTSVTSWNTDLVVQASGLGHSGQRHPLPADVAEDLENHETEEEEVETGTDPCHDDEGHLMPRSGKSKVFSRGCMNTETTSPNHKQSGTTRTSRNRK